MEEKIDDLNRKIEKIKEEKNLEEQEVSHFILEKGKIYKEYEKFDEAISAFKETISTSQSFNLKMDAVFEILLLAIQRKNLILLKEYIEICRKYLKEGGDWEKRNKLRVYEGIYFMFVRDFREAGKFFIDGLMTFTSYELFEYKDFIFYTAICNIITIDRNTLKKKIIDNSDVVSSIKEVPYLEQFLESFYSGQYSKFFEVFLFLIPKIKSDFYIGSHYKYIIREMRIKAYSQYLQSYKSVTLDNMSKNFGVTVEFIDKELSLIISDGRISAKIDKVSGIVECIQEEPVVTMYYKSLKESDILLSKIHKLSKFLQVK